MNVFMGGRMEISDVDPPPFCEMASDHDCMPCPNCGTERHYFAEDPECRDCGMGHPGFYGAMRALIGAPIERKRRSGR